MDQIEFEHWQTVTSSSQCMWVEDAVTRLNGLGCFYCSGGESGIYMRIAQDGTLQAGNYEGAFPHIGDALSGPGRRGNAAVSTRRSNWPKNRAAGSSLRICSLVARTPRKWKREAWHSPWGCEGKVPQVRGS